MSPRESHTFRAQAVVLRHFEFGEADRILTLFTLEHGKIKAIAKGVRKIASRKAGHLEPFTQVNLFFAKGRDLAIITQAETINAFLKIKEDLTLTGYAAYVVELLERFTYEEGANRELYNLLVDTLTRLQDNPFPRNVVHYYEIRLLDLLGFRPNLQTCSQCGKDIKPENQYFTVQGCGVYCPACGRSQADAWPISMTALKYFRHFQRSKYSHVKALEIPGDAEVELSALFEKYMTYLLERSLKVPQFIRDISRQP
jgi:DNA repair protein RecO (recombination protein O)